MGGGGAEQGGRRGDRRDKSEDVQPQCQSLIELYGSIAA